jgi:hypothetical protein
MSDYEVKVTIYDENIPAFWLKKIQKLKKEIIKKEWTCGSIDEDKNEITFYERQILDQDIHIFWYSHQTIRIFCGHDIDRENLKLMEKILQRVADIDIGEIGNRSEIRLDFNCSPKTPNEYHQMGKFSAHTDIPRMVKGHKVKINGYKWNDEIEN